MLIDNLIAFRILYKLVTPFKDTKAFQYGIIDADGKLLRKSSTLKTTQEKEAFTLLDRLVFNLKRLLAKLPGGDAKLKNIVAAYFLIKENYGYDASYELLEEQLTALLSQDAVLVEETATVLEFVSLFEDAPANATGPAVSTDEPVIRRGKGGKRFATFNVTKDVMKRFGSGKKKFSKWNESIEEAQLHEYTLKHPNGVIILMCDESLKAIHRSNSSRKSLYHQMVAEDITV